MNPRTYTSNGKTEREIERGVRRCKPSAAFDEDELAIAGARWRCGGDSVKAQSQGSGAEAG